jgi:hypothetical protein
LLQKPCLDDSLNRDESGSLAVDCAIAASALLKLVGKSHADNIGDHAITWLHEYLDSS